MDSGQFATLAIAVLCMTTLGVAATTLDETVSTTPDDVFNPNLDALSLGKDPAKHANEELDANRKQAQSDGSQNQDASVRNPSEKGEQSQSASSTAPVDLSSSPDQWLSPLVRSVLGVLAAGLIVGLAYRYRRRLSALLLAALPATDRESATNASTDPWEDGEFSDDVERAWYTMVTEANIERPWTKTPDECRQRAVDAGMDHEAVARLTETFRRVRYADGAVGSDDERRARESLARLDAGGQSP